MRGYALFVGARNRKAGRRSFSRADDARVRAITRRHFPEGFTLLHATGAGYDPASGRFVLEESRQLLVQCRSPRRLRAWSNELAAALEQHELLVVTLGAARIIRPTGRRRCAQRK